MCTVHRLHTHNTWILIKFKSCILDRTHYNNPWWESQVSSPVRMFSKILFEIPISFTVRHATYCLSVFPELSSFLHSCISTFSYSWWINPSYRLHFLEDFTVPSSLDCRFSILNISKITSKSYIQIKLNTLIFWMHIKSFGVY